MKFLEKLRTDKMQAMRDKDKVKVGVISLMMSPIALAEKEAKKDLTDEEAFVIVQKELKQTQDTLESIPSSRPELIEETKQKIEVIQSYLPKQMEIDELVASIREIVEEKNLELSPKSKGIVIKEMLSRYQGKTDGKHINEALAEVLK